MLESILSEVSSPRLPGAAVLDGAGGQLVLIIYIMRMQHIPECLQHLAVLKNLLCCKSRAMYTNQTQHVLEWMQHVAVLENLLLAMMRARHE